MDLREMITDGRVILLGIVRQELLTGIADSNAFDAMQLYLNEFDDLPPGADDYVRAAAFANLCQSSGIAATTADMLLCSMAAARDLPLFTTDRDFDRYSAQLPIRLFSSS